MGHLSAIVLSDFDRSTRVGEDKSQDGLTICLPEGAHRVASAK
jgi:hypothetical protein